MGKRVVVQQLQKAMLDSLKTSKDVSYANKTKQKPNTDHHTPQAYGSGPKAKCIMLQLVQHIKTAKAIPSIWPDLEQLWEDEKLSIYRSVPKQQGKQTVQRPKSRPVHDKQQNDEVNWNNSYKKNDMQIDAVTIRSLNFNSIRSVIMPELKKKTCSRQKRSRVEYKIDTGSDDIYLPQHDKHTENQIVSLAIMIK